MTDEQLAATMQAKSHRQVMAEFLVALGQLVVHHQIPAPLTDLCINIHGRAMRVDIATITADGDHIDTHLLAINANVHDPALGEPIVLAFDGPVQ